MSERRDDPGRRQGAPGGPTTSDTATTPDAPPASRHPGLDRTAGVVGAITYGMVGVLPLATDLAVSPAWWVLWVVGMPLFGVLVLAELRRRVAIAVLAGAAVTGTALYALEPMYAFGAVPMVVVAACAGLILALPVALAVVVALSVVLVLVGAHGELGVGMLAAVFYIGLMVFAVLTGQIARREALASDALAVVHADLSRAHDELRRAHAELEAAQARLAQTSRNDERLRIARDLHDLVGHQLSALAVNLEVASHLAEGRAAEHVDKARAAAKDLLGDVRDVVGRLREPQGELRAVLTDMAAAFPRPDVRLTIAEELGDVAPEPAEALVRCVQELLTNAVRHSGASTVWVDVAREDGRLVVDARDNGRGAEHVRPGNGLTGMRERVTALGGAMEVDGAAGAGFRVRLRIPAGAAS